MICPPPLGAYKLVKNPLASKKNGCVAVAESRLSRSQVDKISTPPCLGNASLDTIEIY